MRGANLQCTTHHLSASDITIAKRAIRLGAALCTFNIEHFRP